MAQQRKRKAKTKVTAPTDPIPFEKEIIDTKKMTWVFGNPLGSGGCGAVYEGRDGSSRSFDYVIKIEHHENGPLYAEIHVYHAIGKQESVDQFVKTKRLNFVGVPVCYGTGSFEYNNKKYRFMILKRFGKDLQSILKKNNNTLHPKTVFTVGSIVMNALEYIHNLGYVHHDIKAGNLVLGSAKDTANHVYLLDMGLATRYVTKEGVHKSDKPNPGKANDGTPEFLSRDGHLGVFSRRSDLEILGYNMLLWLSGTLPWIDIKNPTKLKEEKDKYMSDVPSLMKCLLPRFSYPELEEFLMYVSTLGFEEVPRYDRCTVLFKRALKSLGIKDDGILILEEPAKKAEKDSFASDSESSQKENHVKKPDRKKRVNAGASTSSVLASGEVLTPAMLEVLQRQQEKAAEKATKKPRKKAA